MYCDVSWYCKTGKIRDRLISRIRELGSFATGKFRESGGRGGLHLSPCFYGMKIGLIQAEKKASKVDHSICKFAHTTVNVSGMHVFICLDSCDSSTKCCWHIEQFNPTEMLLPPNAFTHPSHVNANTPVMLMVGWDVVHWEWDNGLPFLWYLRLYLSDLDKQGLILKLRTHTVIQKYSRAGKFCESRDIRENREIFLHAKICCSTVDHDKSNHFYIGFTW